MNFFQSLIFRFRKAASARRLKHRIGYVSESFGLNRYWLGDHTAGALYQAPKTFVDSLAYAGADKLIWKRTFYETENELRFVLLWKDFCALAERIHRYRVEHGVKERAP